MVGGLPNSLPGHAEAIADIAMGMREYVFHINSRIDQKFAIRMGVDNGPLVVGAVGGKKF